MKTEFIYPESERVQYLRTEKQDPENSERRTHFNNPVNLAECFTFNKSTFRCGPEPHDRLSAIRFLSAHGIEVLWVFNTVRDRDDHFEGLMEPSGVEETDEVDLNSLSEKYRVRKN